MNRITYYSDVGRTVETVEGFWATLQRLWQLSGDPAVGVIEVVFASGFVARLGPKA